MIPDPSHIFPPRPPFPYTTASDRCSMYRRQQSSVHKDRPIINHRLFVYKLNRSKLKPSLLRIRRITPILKNFSSPPGVRPPIYHLSAPSTSRKPSLLESLPRRRDEGLGMGMPAPGLVATLPAVAEAPAGERIATLWDCGEVFAEARAFEEVVEEEVVV